MDTDRHIAVVSMHPLYDTRITNHLHTLCDSGFKVTYINWSNRAEVPEDELFNQIEVVHRHDDPVIGYNVFRYVGLLFWFLSRCRKARADLYHLHDPLLMPLIPCMAFFSRRRVVFDIHEHYPRFPGLMGRIFALFYRVCLPFAHGLVATSPTQMPREDRPNAIVPNYQSRRDFDADPDDDVATRPLTVTYFGDLHTESRDVPGMLDVADQVLENRDDIGFKFGGTLGGPEEDQLRARFELMAKKYGERFQWFGVMPRAKVVEHTRTADIGLLLLNRGSMNLTGCSPNKIFEYLAVGAVSLSTDCFVIADQVRDRAGILFPPEADPQSVADAIIELATDRKRLAEMKAASAEIGRDYTWESVAPRYLELYESLL